MADQTMLYKPSDFANPEAWNRNFATLIVDDEDIPAAQADGWLLAADIDKVVEAPRASLLDNSAKVIVAALPDLGVEDLQLHLAEEIAGKNRAGVVKALNEAIAASEAPE